MKKDYIREISRNPSKFLKMKDTDEFLRTQYPRYAN